MGRTFTKRRVKLVGVIGPQTNYDTECVSLFTDNENEYPIVRDRKASKLAKLIGQRVEVEGELIYRWKTKEMELRVNHFHLSDVEEFEPMVRTLEPALPIWELMPAYA